MERQTDIQTQSENWAQLVEKQTVFQLIPSAEIEIESAAAAKEGEWTALLDRYIESNCR